MNLSTAKAFKEMDGVGVKVEGETLKRCQKVMLGIADDVIAACEEAGIWYALGGGTALGAVRHRGFIPWDDDVDINVLGRDYERLKEVIERRYGDKYTFQNYRSADYGLPMGRIVLNNSVYRSWESVGSDVCGFFIDVFPIENAPDNKLLRKLHGILCMGAGLCLSCRKFFHSRAFLNEVAKNSPEMKKVIRLKIALGGLLGVIPLSGWATITDRLCGLCKNERSEYVTIPSGRKHYFKGMARRELLTETAPAEFEGRQWAVAADRDGYLRRLYGPDYMTPPKGEPEHHMILELRFPEE